jgi:hypothetical protein
MDAMDLAFNQQNIPYDTGKPDRQEMQVIRVKFHGDSRSCNANAEAACHTISVQAHSLESLKLEGAPE